MRPLQCPETIPSAKWVLGCLFDETKRAHESNVGSGAWCCSFGTVYLGIGQNRLVLLGRVQVHGNLPRLLGQSVSLAGMEGDGYTISEVYTLQSIHPPCIYPVVSYGWYSTIMLAAIVRHYRSSESR